MSPNRRMSLFSPRLALSASTAICPSQPNHYFFYNKSLSSSSLFPAPRPHSLQNHSTRENKHQRRQLQTAAILPLHNGLPVGFKQTTKHGFSLPSFPTPPSSSLPGFLRVLPALSPVPLPRTFREATIYSQSHGNNYSGQGRSLLCSILSAFCPQRDSLHLFVTCPLRAVEVSFTSSSAVSGYCDHYRYRYHHLHSHHGCVMSISIPKLNRHALRGCLSSETTKQRRFWRDSSPWWWAAAREEAQDR